MHRLVILLGDRCFGKENPLTSRNSNRFAGSGATAALVLTGMLVLGSAFTARAESDESQNGLEGTWRLEVKVFTDCSDQKTLARPIFKALAAFSKGGTLTLTTAGQLPSVQRLPAWACGVILLATTTLQSPNPSYLVVPWSCYPQIH